MSFKKAQLATVIATALLAATAAPVASADRGHGPNHTVVYMTRHAEKQNELDEIQSEICNIDGDCAEELSAIGENRANLLAEWFESQGILDDITDVISSDKQRTRQTVEPTAAKLILMGVDLETEDNTDGIEDGVRQVPEFDANTAFNELTGNSKSVGPTVTAIEALTLESGNVALVAAHSGTIYRIMGGEDTDGNPATGDDTTTGLGIDTTVGDNLADITLFPKKEFNGKVPTFGDVWKIVINNNTGEAKVVWRKNLQPGLTVENQTIVRGNNFENLHW